LTADVSSIKILSKMWNPELKGASPAKKYEHRALGDIKESIMELQYYREHLWKVKDIETDTKDS
jgi:oligoribonuclease